MCYLFTSGGLHEKHVVATWNLGTISAFAYRHRETKKNLRRGGEKPASRWRKTCVEVEKNLRRGGEKPASRWKNLRRGGKTCVEVELIFSRQIFEKYSDIKYHENPSSGSRVVPCGQTDRHDEADSRSSQFCGRVWKHVADVRIFNSVCFIL